MPLLITIDDVGLTYSLRVFPEGLGFSPMSALTIIFRIFLAMLFLFWSSLFRVIDNTLDGVFSICNGGYSRALGFTSDVIHKEDFPYGIRILPILYRFPNFSVERGNILLVAHGRLYV